IALDDIHVRYGADLRYLGQSFEISVPVSGELTGRDRRSALAEDFKRLYDRMYGHTNAAPVEIVNIRCVAFKKVDPLDSYEVVTASPLSRAGDRCRDVCFLGQSGPVSTPIYWRP